MCKFLIIFLIHSFDSFQAILQITNIFSSDRQITNFVDTPDNIWKMY